MGTVLVHIMTASLFLFKIYFIKSSMKSKGTVPIDFDKKSTLLQINKNRFLRICNVCAIEYCKLY